MREKKVETYLVEQVEAAGGLCEKHVSPGRRGVPDRLATWPVALGWNYDRGFVDLVETKRPGGEARDEQVRDHKRRAARGVPVYLIDTKAKVDEYVRHRIEGRPAPHLYSVPL